MAPHQGGVKGKWGRMDQLLFLWRSSSLCLGHQLLASSTDSSASGMDSSLLIQTHVGHRPELQTLD